MVERSAKVKNKLGIHARPAAYLVQAASKFSAKITFVKDGLEVNGKSIMGVMMLAAEEGSEIDIRAVGNDADEAVAKLLDMIENEFD